MQEEPSGLLMLRTVPQPSDLNINGNIFGGWVLSQMDIAGGTQAARIAKGSVATVAIESMQFLCPINVGDIVSIYVDGPVIGRSSIKLRVRVYAEDTGDSAPHMVTEGMFIFVAVDGGGKPRHVPQ